MRLVVTRRSSRWLAICDSAPSASLLNKELDVACDGADLEGDVRSARVPVEAEGEQVERIAAVAEQVKEGVEEKQSRECDLEQVGVSARQ